MINALRVNGRPVIQRKRASPLTLRDVMLDALRTINSRPPQPCCDECSRIIDTAGEVESTGLVESAGSVESTEANESVAIAESTGKPKSADEAKSTVAGESPAQDKSINDVESTACLESSIADESAALAESTVLGELVATADAFEESKHPRGQPENAGEFVKGSGTSTETAESTEKSESTKTAESTEKSESAKAGESTVKSESESQTGGSKSTESVESVTYSKVAKPPAELHGVAFKSWTPPEEDGDWETLVGTNRIKEPKLPPLATWEDNKGKRHTLKRAAGVIIQEPDGRVWLIKPKNEYGGYKHTWPKGTVEEGMTLQATAIKEAYEETGLHVQLTGYAGDVERDTSVGRYYYAKRVGGTPADAGEEAEGVALVDPKEIDKFLNRSTDRKMAAKFLKSAEANEGTEVSESGVAGKSTEQAKPAEKAESTESLKLSDLKKIGSNLGSNPGGTYTDKNGKKYYVKISKSADHAKNEILASQLYEAAGAPILKALPVDMDGKLGTATEWVSGVKNIDRHDKAQIKEAQKYFAVHAWLANWDAAGLGFDNQGIVNGKMTTLDPGGSLIFRAQGGPKGDAFGDKVTEWASLRNPSNAQANKIFGDMTPAQLKESAHLVAKIPDETIRDLVNKQGPGNPNEKSKLADRLIKRKADIVAKASATGDAYSRMSKPRLFIDVNLNGRHERVRI